MAYNTSLVWVCSKIGGLKRSLDNLLPRVAFIEISEDKLKGIEYHLNGIGKSEHPQALIADNGILPRLIHEGKIPFKFIQVGEIYRLRPNLTFY